MNRHCERLISILSQPTVNRHSDEIRHVINWLRSTVPNLRTVKSDVISDVIRLGNYKQCHPDEVIVCHSEKDDNLYIILAGTASVYIGTKQKAFQPESGNIGGGPGKTNPASSVTDESPLAIPSDGKRRRSSTRVTLEDNSSGKEQSTTTEIISGNKEQETMTTSNEKLKRDQIGRFSAKIGAGKCVGGIAKRSDDSLRNTTIVCDEVVHILHLTRDAYNQTLKMSQDAELTNRQRFITTHPLFARWGPKLKQFLEVNLTKQIYNPGQPIVRQGDQCDGLIFILSGQANVLVESEKHRSQYSNLSVFSNETEDIQNEGSKKLRKVDVVPKPPPILEPIMVRRRFGYAVAEKRLRTKQLNLCCIEKGEIIGDIELVSKLDSYCLTIIPTETVEAYILSAKSFERIGSKAFSESMNILKIEVETKLSNRAERMKENGPPLFPYLLMKIRYTQEPPPARIPPLVSSKSLPSEEELFQHLIKSFLDNKSSLVRPYVSGGLYYLDMMRTKAKQRRSSPEHPKISIRMNTKPRLHMMKPLTTRAIKDALKRQENELEMVEETARLQEMRLREDQKTKDQCDRLVESFELKAETPPLTEHAMMSLQQVLLNKIRLRSSQNSESFEKLLTSYEGEGRAGKTGKRKESRRFDALKILKSTDSTEKLRRKSHRKKSIREIPAAINCSTPPIEHKTESSTDATSQLEKTDGNDGKRILENKSDGKKDSGKSVTSVAGTKERIDTKGENPVSIDKSRKVDSSSTQEVDRKKKCLAQNTAEVNISNTSSLLESTDEISLRLQRTRTFLSEHDNQSEPADIQKDIGEVSEEVGDAREVHSARADLSRNSRRKTGVSIEAEKQRRPVAVGRKMKGTVVLNLAKDLCEERARNKLNRELISAEDALFDSPMYRDWETSERSLKYLEERIARFHKETDKEKDKDASPIFIPKLRRFEPSDDDPKHAAPGGKVYVKRRACDVHRAKGIKIKDHAHVRYHLLPSIPNYNQLRTSKLVMFHILDDARQKWNSERYTTSS